ncbi:MAG: TIGR03663 family protein, partial [Puniceicoccales bacterium]|nr:TIGR03663 family protein [Puniceicoccales bacterium]
MRRFSVTGYSLLLIALLALAVVLRFWGLGEKPLHTDEAVQAYKLGQLLSGSGYTYDPIDHHGPILYYLEAVVCRIAGQNSFAELTAAVLRIIPALFGVLLVFAVFLWRRCGVDKSVLIAATCLGATSPMAVYYARYFIQETILVACFWAAVPLWWRLCFGNKDTTANKWALAMLSGVLFGLAVSAKETWVLMIGAVILALAIIWGVGFVRHSRRRDSSIRESSESSAALPMTFSRCSVLWLAVSLGVAIVVAAAFYSSFGKNPQGVVDAASAYAGYFQKTSGGPHDKWVGWYGVNFFGTFKLGKSNYIMEGITICACLITLCALSVRKIWKPEERRIAAFSLLSGGILFLIYSFISYKTPWLLLGVLPPLWLAAGYGVILMWRFLLKHLPLLGIPCAVTAVFLLVYNCWQLTRRLAVDERNPLAYVHTSGDILRVEPWVKRLESVSPDKAGFHVNVIASE